MLAGCAGSVRSPRAAPDWSRGLAVGESSFSAAVALYVQPDGSLVHLAWGQVSAEGDGIRYVQINTRAQVIQDRILPIAVRSPRQVRLLPHGEGGLIALWLNGISEERRLLAVRLDSSGQPLGEPVQLSESGPEADSYAAVASASGAEVFWSHEGADEARGIYHVHLDRDGQTLSGSRRIVEGGISPGAQMGSDGRLHLAWFLEPKSGEKRVYYAPFDPHKPAVEAPRQVGAFMANLKVRSHGPAIALSGDRAYIFWAWERLVTPIYLLSAPEAGQGECHYVILPLESGAEPSEEQALNLPVIAHPAYQPASGSYAYTQLAQTAPGSDLLVQVIDPLPGFISPVPGTNLLPRETQLVGFNSMAVYMPSPAPGARDEVAVSVTFQTATKRSRSLSIGVAYLSSEVVKGYQIAGRSASVAMRPTLAADKRGHLHLAWLEPGGVRRYVVYYASTAPETREALGKLTLRDVGDALMSVAWGLVQAVSLFPMAFLALFAPLAWIVAYLIATAEGDLNSRRSRIALAVAILLYIPAKFFLLPPDLLSAPPFSDRVSQAWANALTIGVPIAILAFALGILWIYLKRAETRSLLAAYLIFGATDAFLTVGLYAPGFIG